MVQMKKFNETTDAWAQLRKQLGVLMHLKIQLK